MKKNLLLLVMITILLTATACKTTTLQAPETGLLFAIDTTSPIEFDEYELNLKDDAGGSIVVTLKKEDAYQARWSQTLVDKYQGKTYTVITLQGYNTRKPGDLTEYAAPFTIVFQNGTTDQGRLVQVKLN